jgi:hypothetical protein
MWGSTHPLYLVGTGGVFPGNKAAGMSEVSAKVNEWSYTATPIRFRGVYRDTCTFLRDVNEEGLC